MAVAASDIPASEDLLRIESRWFVGVDLGQSHDPTAVSVIEAKFASIRPTLTAWHVPKAKAALKEYQPAFHVLHLERLPLGMAYPDQVLYVAGVVARPPLEKPMTLIDFSGVGRPVYDLFSKARIPNLSGIAITGGREIKRKPYGWSVPKQILVSKVQALLHTKQLQIEEKLKDATALTRELQDFRVTYTSAGNAIFNARVGAHDDLVLAVCLAIFGATLKRPATTINVQWPT